MRRATILIAARDAGATIERAIRSAVAQTGAPIVLVDDYSADDTVAIARAVAPSIHIVRPPHHGHLGLTRQAALDVVETPWAVWLDADDELLPGRVDRLVAAMCDVDADLAFDEVSLADGATGRPFLDCPIPAFLDEPPFLVRLFERNYLPGIGQVAFRTSFARRIGYDPDLHGTEDTDFALRSIAADARVALIHAVGYRMYAYPSSVSRQRSTQREMYRRALAKHDYADVRRRAMAAGASARLTPWILASMAIFRAEYPAALAFVDEAVGGGDDDRWRAAFHRGTLQLLMDNAIDAVPLLLEAEHVCRTAEGANNLGVALARIGEARLARNCFVRALALYPSFADARANATSRAPERITTHPLRREAARADYAVAS